MLGELLALTGDYAGAATAYEELIADRVGDVAVFANLAVTYEELGRPAFALLAAQQALRVDPNRVEALLSRASAQRWLGDREGALASHRMAAALRPDDPWLRLEVLRSLQEVGRFAECGGLLAPQERERSAAGLELEDRA